VRAVTVAEATRALDVRTTDFVYRIVRSGVLRSTRIDGRIDIDPASVDEYLERRALRTASLDAKRSALADSSAEARKRFRP
jgi:hypothetical protein